MVALWLGPTWEHLLLLVGPLAVVPLGLGLVGERSDPGARGVFWRAAVVTQLPAAFLLAGSLALEPGTVAGSLAAPWLLVTVLMALLAVTRLMSRQGGPIAELAIDAGLAMSAVGGTWTVLTRAGIQVLDFSPVIVLLTAVHFHFAGFTLPVVAGLVGRAGAEAGPVKTAYQFVVFAILGGVPLVALGITASPTIEWLASWLLAPAAVCVALFQIAFARREGPLPRLLLSASAGCLIFGMALAGVYALGEYLERVWLDIPTMVRWHGSSNALGFGLLGLIGHTLGRGDAPPSTVDSYERKPRVA